MIQQSYDHLDNVKQVNEFLNYHNILRGNFFDSQISVEDFQGNTSLACSCQCNAFYNDKYNRYDINIFWDYTKSELDRLKLKGIYNSRNYKIQFVESNLIIETDNRYIVIKFVK